MNILFRFEEEGSWKQRKAKFIFTFIKNKNKNAKYQGKKRHYKQRAK